MSPAAVRAERLAELTDAWCVTAPQDPKPKGRLCGGCVTNSSFLEAQGRCIVFLQLPLVRSGSSRRDFQEPEKENCVC